MRYGVADFASPLRSEAIRSVFWQKLFLIRFSDIAQNFELYHLLKMQKHF